MTEIVFEMLDECPVVPYKKVKSKLYIEMRKAGVNNSDVADTMAVILIGSMILKGEIAMTNSGKGIKRVTS